MIVKRLVAAGIVLWLGAALGACSPFAGYVADNWPHWAGGLPPDAPPRPGAPGYDEFIAHGQTDQDATKSAATGEKPAAAEKSAAGAVKTSVQPAPAAQAMPSDSTSPENPSVVKGGLY